MDVTYYPGCSLGSSARDYNESIKAVCKALDINLHEPDDWTCCGATSAHSLDDESAITLPALNLSAAERSGNDMMVPCPLCYNRLKRAQEAVKSSIVIYDMASFLGQNEWLEKIRSRLKTSLGAVKAVCYYGCMANRPPKVMGSVDYENPCDMDNIAKALGVDIMPWSYKTDCCGASFSLSRRDIVYTLVKSFTIRRLRQEPNVLSFPARCVRRILTYIRKRFQSISESRMTFRSSTLQNLSVFPLDSGSLPHGSNVMW